MKEIQEKLTAQPFDPKAPLVSIIVPVYNAGPVLQETLDDLRAQTVRNFEMIFVDDGSTDDSCAILERNAKEDPRIQILHQQNRFAGVARNAGIEVAKGRYLLFLDADDRFLPQLLERTCACAEERRAEVVLYHADLMQMPEKTFRTSPAFSHCDVLPKKPLFAGPEGREHLFDIAVPWTKLYRHDYIKRLGIRYQPLYSGNDVYFNMVGLACAERIAPLPEILVHYRIGHGGNIQAKRNKEPLDYYHAFLAVKQELERRGLFEAYRVPFTAKAAQSLLYSFERMTTLDEYRRLYDTLHNGGCRELGLDNVPDMDKIYPRKEADRLRRCREICEMDFDQFALKALIARRTLDKLTYEVELLRGSHAYRLGSKLTSPLHALKGLLGKR